MTTPVSEQARLTDSMVEAAAREIDPDIWLKIDRGGSNWDWRKEQELKAARRALEAALAQRPTLSPRDEEVTGARETHNVMMALLAAERLDKMACEEEKAFQPTAPGHFSRLAADLRAEAAGCRELAALAPKLNEGVIALQNLVRAIDEDRISTALPDARRLLTLIGGGGK